MEVHLASAAPSGNTPIAASGGEPGIRPFPVPTSYFSVALGTVALGLAWRYGAKVGHVPAWAGEAILALAGVVWALLLGVFMAKMFRRRDALRLELQDLVACCFISLIPVTSLEIGIAARPYAPGFAWGLVLVSLAGQLAFSMYRAAGLWRGLHTPAATTPVIYLPTVASSFASAAALGAMGHLDWGMLFFGAGMFSWFSLEAAILARLRTGPALAPPVRGIIGIQLAPAFVGGNAWLAVNGGQVDVFLLLLVGYGLLQLAFLVRLLPWVLEAGYTMSLWGFSFGLAAMASVGMHLVVAGQLVELGWVLWWLGSGLVAALWVGLLGLAVQGRLLVR